MAKAWCVTLLLFALMTVYIEMANAGTPKTICRVTINELAECLPAVMGQKPPPPTADCCAALRKADLRCMCNKKSELGQLGINPAAAMKLPKQCKINVPHGC
ncbi:putative lipid-transfer protein DIR1 [Nicotiana tabacum]|uniref:Lipid-transfer protein DIR1 n=1 Tax=Nicotiana tabacum TaxID=4097 RepID=A0A1S4ABI9_TOBAC|nr:PREDICTED: putative lipid-transfer protein DIR1 [Nicotiana tabacum]XP_018633315.1 putative lipid-transfer protein DIR1 [Nicotiana tomentosiformis]